MYPRREALEYPIFDTDETVTFFRSGLTFSCLLPSDNTITRKSRIDGADRGGRTRASGV